MAGGSPSSLPANDDPGGIDRRSVLAKLGVGAGIAWVAPTVLSSPAFAQGSCNNDAITWSAQSLTGLDGTPVTILTSFATVVVSYDETGVTGGGTATAGDPTLAPQGGTSSYVEVLIDLAASGDFVTVTFAFASPVENLTFSLLDIDKGDTFWQDEVTVSATLAATGVAMTSATFNATLISQTTSGTDEIFLAITDESGVGTGTDGSTTNANVDINYAAQIDTLVITYSNPSTDLEPQQIGIGDFTFCAY